MISEKQRFQREKKQQALNEASTKLRVCKNENIASINREIKVKKSGIRVAEESMQDGSKHFQNCFAKRSLKREQIQQAQSNIEMGLKRKVHLEKEVSTLEEKEKEERTQLDASYHM